VIASGTSSRHVKTLADDVEFRLRELGRRPLRREGITDASWILLDFGDVVVHLFDQETRRYYDLERLWSDAPRLEFQPAGS
jgi:ribosome-associated protein